MGEEEESANILHRLCRQHVFLDVIIIREKEIASILRQNRSARRRAGNVGLPLPPKRWQGLLIRVHFQPGLGGGGVHQVTVRPGGGGVHRGPRILNQSHDCFCILDEVYLSLQ